MAVILFGFLLCMMQTAVALTVVREVALYVEGPALAIMVLGMILIGLGRPRVGVKFVQLASIAFLPFGFVSLLGARSVLSALGPPVPPTRDALDAEIRIAWPRWVLVGLALACVGLVGSTTLLAVVGVTLVCVAFWGAANPVVRIYPQTLVLEPSLMQGRQVIAREEFGGAALDGRALTVTFDRDGEQCVQRANLSWVSKADRVKLSEALEKFYPTNRN